MQPFQNIDSKERFIDVQTSDGIEKYSPRFLYVDSTGPRTTIYNIVDPKIRAFYQSDDVLGDFFDLIKKNRKSTDISNTNKFGASDTDPKDLSSNIGTLALFPQATQFAEALVPKTNLLSPEEQAFLFFTKMTAEAAKPGATALGAAGEDFIKTRLSQKALETKRAGDVASVASSIFSAIKPKVGVPQTVITGVALDDNNQPRVNDAGKGIFKYTTYGPNGEVLGTFEASKSDQSVNVTTTMGVKEKLELKQGEKQLDSLNTFYDGDGKKDGIKGVIAQGIAANQNLSRLNEIETFLKDEELETGILEDKINRGQLLLNRFGFDFDEKAISKSENLEKLTNEMVLESVAQMKGALSNKELDFLRAIQVNIGNTKTGNLLILLGAKHGLRKNLEWNDFFNKFKKDNNIQEFRQPMSMSDDFNKNIELATKLKTQWENYLNTERPNMYQAMRAEADEFVNKLQKEGKSEDEIEKAYKDKYMFKPSPKAEPIDMLEFIEGIFNRTNR